MALSANTRSDLSTQLLSSSLSMPNGLSTICNGLHHCAWVPPDSSGIIAAGSAVFSLETVDSAAAFAFSSANFSTLFCSFPPLTDTAKNSLHVSHLSPFHDRLTVFFGPVHDTDWSVLREYGLYLICVSWATVSLVSSASAIDDLSVT